MLANRIILNSLLKRQFPIVIQASQAHATGGMHDELRPIGKREWVGYGINGTPHYIDRVDFPMPAVRFLEVTPEIQVLREKEKGNWKNLTLEEKKKLYRASFRQTLCEVEAPTGQWKSVLGWTLFFTALGLWIFILEKLYLYKPLPRTFSEEWRAKQFRNMIENRHGHLTGLASKWDYEKDDWKK